MVITILTFIIVFGILVLVHEFGHFYFAKKAGILVREFSIGMGPKVFAHETDTTTYTLRILPLGGYVRMAGLEDDEEEFKPGQIVSLQLDHNNQVSVINASQKKLLFNGIPLQISKWDLTDELWLEGYLNGDDSQLKRYQVSHDASIIEEDGTKIRIAPRDVQFQSAKLWQRMLTNFAGPMNNFLLAIVAFALVALLQGGVYQTTNQVGTFTANSVARQAGIKSGDRIVAVAGKKTKNWQALAQEISRYPGKKTQFTIKRQHQIKQIWVTPRSEQQNGKKVGVIGIEASQNHSFAAIIVYGFTASWNLLVELLAAIKSMFTQGFNLNDLGGPVAIYSYTSQAAKYGLTSVINLLAFLSLNLGVVNLFPIPALDGGKLLLNVVEAIRRKSLSSEKEGILTLIGFGFLMLLMILVTWNDIQRYFF
ncbi:RIP metalloprotease RseP [Liquorilactobacillus sicerae]|uniref:RIP metalloprotease RseP n=1 Tax=Liquorilactobacillus sicerae TaxID=1416943 RepID=UPI00247FBF5C|nr:RIP metalloprotease RseP [Liquorilactobacillus sicerae]